ncbi:pantoate--beta-alanine ligase [Algoriphagus limi]|uniref:Pantothenate synthetase n=1 Tax=Algoriphagus limi TaxID=2975273 RepID=A0ABT2G6P3_9BACT|nr:pantoate--beta-alanine ligase [Algoriphagus limi]
MQVFNTPAEWAAIRLQFQSKNPSIGLVPTMGALHEGHLGLVTQCIKKSGVSVVSIFVNPTQFNNPEDFEKYPNSLQEDLDLLEKAGVDYVFVPEVKTMYPQETNLKIDFGSLERVLEGAFRPGHFNGVGIIVSKLFHMIQPDLAFFGQKDLQQVAIIKRMVNDLSFPIQLEIVSTRRETDGLALSSRNRRLSPSEREKALILYQSMVLAKKELLEGKSWFEVQQTIQREFEKTEGVDLEYFELVETDQFELFTDFDPQKKNSICVAAYVGEVRLIDNLPVIS